MNDAKLTHMADILPLSIEPTVAPGTLLISVLLLITALALVWFIHRFHTPLARLRRDLQGNKLSPRQAAHALAQMTQLNPEQADAVNRLRFAAVEPDRETVLALIRKSRLIDVS